MGTGIHGGFGNTYGIQAAFTNIEEEMSLKNDQELVKQPILKISNVNLPPNNDQLRHIFAEREGHLEDTPENRKLLLDLANNEKYFIGTDKYGNSWNAEITEEGTQYWVRYRDNIINDGGRNMIPREWDQETGFNNNPFKGENRNE